jgi:Uma2 family endonuclease
MTINPTHLPPVAEEIEYPETDGQPMGETEYHVLAIMYLFQALRHHFRRQKVYVAADMFLYYVRGDPGAVKSPDVMVIKDVPKHRRRTFKTWVEKAVPCVVFEMVSANTVDDDLGPKRDTYAGLGVKEYFLFDPEADALDPPLRGFRLKGKRYVPIVPAADGSLTSTELGLRLSAEGDLPRLSDAKTGKLLPGWDELVEQAEQRAKRQKERAEKQKRRADALAAEVTRLREELERQKRQP